MTPTLLAEHAIDDDRRAVSPVPIDNGAAFIARLAIVDPHPLIRWALSAMAGQTADLTLVGEASTADHALTLAHALRPDVLTIDAGLPDGQAWKLSLQLRETYPDLGIVIISDTTEDHTLFRALECGASALVAKTVPIAELASAIRHAATSPLSFSAPGLAAALRRRNTRPVHAALSPRELQILLLLHDGFSVPQIAAQLFVSLSTAKTHVSRLYDKLSARNRAQALMTAMRLGIFEDAVTAA